MIEDSGLMDKYEYYEELFDPALAERLAVLVDGEVDVSGPVIPAILNFLDHHPFDLMVLGTHGRHGLPEGPFRTADVENLGAAESNACHRFEFGRCPLFVERSIAPFPQYGGAVFPWRVHKLFSQPALFCGMEQGCRFDRGLC